MYILRHNVSLFRIMNDRMNDNIAIRYTHGVRNMINIPTLSLNYGIIWYVLTAIYLQVGNNSKTIHIDTYKSQSAHAMRSSRHIFATKVH